MLRKEIYPKTERLNCLGDKVYVTEKLDGSNLCIFKKDNKLHIAQRKMIITMDELQDNKDKLYKDLYNWILEYKNELEENLVDKSVLCGEWIGMGKLKYPVDEFDKRFYMFAKANIDDNYNLYNIYYDHSLFTCPFINQKIPFYIGIVPEIIELTILPNKKHLDSIYEKYRNKVGRDVEGFVLNYKNVITKYVRMKNGKLQEHFDRSNKK